MRILSCSLALAALAAIPVAQPPQPAAAQSCGITANTPVVSGSNVNGNGVTNCGNGGPSFGITVTLYRNGTAVATASHTVPGSAPAVQATATYACPAGTTTASYYTYVHTGGGNATSATVSLTCTG